MRSFGAIVVLILFGFYAASEYSDYSGFLDSALGAFRSDQNRVYEACRRQNELAVGFSTQSSMNVCNCFSDVIASAELPDRDLRLLISSLRSNRQVEGLSLAGSVAMIEALSRCVYADDGPESDDEGQARQRAPASSSVATRQRADEGAGGELRQSSGDQRARQTNEPSPPTEPDPEATINVNINVETNGAFDPRNYGLNNQICSGPIQSGPGHLLELGACSFHPAGEIDERLSREGCSETISCSFRAEVNGSNRIIRISGKIDVLK